MCGKNDTTVLKIIVQVGTTNVASVRSINKEQYVLHRKGYTVVINISH